MPPANPPVGYRIRQGETLAAYVWSGDNVVLGGHFRVLYDDGSLEDWSLDQLTTGTTRARLQMFANRVAQKDGWVVAGGFTFQAGTRTKYGMTYAQVGIIAEPGSDETWRGTVCQGYIYFGHTLSVGEFVEPESWTLYEFQGTIAEDATAGTHINTLTIVPATGSECELLYAKVKVGNTATSQVLSIGIDDGVNSLADIMAAGSSVTTANAVFSLPTNTAFAVTGNAAGAGGRFRFANPMRLVLLVQTAAVSVTETFSAVLLVRGGIKPTSTLADTVGAPVLTTNTDLLVGAVQPV